MLFCLFSCVYLRRPYFTYSIVSVSEIHHACVLNDFRKPLLNYHRKHDVRVEKNIIEKPSRTWQRAQDHQPLMSGNGAPLV